MMNVRSVRGVVGSVDLLGRTGSFLKKRAGWRGFQRQRAPFGVTSKFSPGKSKVI
jgi:hypothetical protein